MSRIADAFSVVMGAKALASGDPAPDLYGSANVPGRRVSNRRAAAHSEAYGGKEAIDYVMNAVGLYARTASHATYYFERDGKRLVENPRAPEVKGQGYSAAPADLVELFAHPNRGTDYTEHLQLSIIDLLLTGEFFWLYNETNGLGQPKEVYRVPPRLMEVKPGRVEPAGYVYNRPNGPPLDYAPDRVLHVKLPNPHDPWRGLGVIQGNPQLYDIALAVDRSIRDYYERGTRLTGTLESDRGLPEPTWVKIKREFTNLYSGAANAFGVAFLSHGLKFNPISAHADEAAFDTAQDKVRDRIYGAFGQSAVLHGEVGGSTDRQAVREAQRIFDNKVMRPFLDALTSQVSHKLTSAWDGIEWCVEYEYVAPIEDKYTLAANAMNIPATVDEVRSIVDLPPLGDERGKQLVVEVGGPGPRAAAGNPPPNPSGATPYPADGTRPDAAAQAQKAVESVKRLLQVEAD